ncbi:MAG TPA: rhodanese-like domain-containing protein, partial [Candidatus Rifleibacterium sp.]|nr:rhodanese-like domain-containing protein [Candidatus Rifleibacterium sp.]
LYAQVVGGLIFGIGFVIGGWCPGTAAVGMVSGKFDALIFLVGAMIGSFLFNDFFGILEPLYTMEDMGRSFIYELAGMTFAQFGLLLTVIAVIAFWFSELIEEKFKFTLVASRSNGLWVFSVIILLSACGNLLLDKFPIDSVRFATASSEEILLKIETGQDHIEPEIFAREKLAGQKKIALIDVRTREEFDEWHIPGAAHQPLSSLVAGLERYRRFDRIVLYSNGATHPGQAWAVLNAAGFKNVYILADGLQGFYERVLKPVSLRPEFISDRDRAEINTWRAMFLGSGMAAGASTPVSSGALTGP